MSAQAESKVVFETIQLKHSPINKTHQHYNDISR